MQHDALTGHLIGLVMLLVILISIMLVIKRGTRNPGSRKIAGGLIWGVFVWMIGVLIPFECPNNGPPVIPTSVLALCSSLICVFVPNTRFSLFWVTLLFLGTVLGSFAIPEFYNCYGSDRNPQCSTGMLWHTPLTGIHHREGDCKMMHWRPGIEQEINHRPD